MPTRKGTPRKGTQPKPPSPPDKELQIRRGPSKERQAGVPAPRLTRHKPRSGWFRARVSWPLREGPITKLQFERKRVAQRLASVVSVAQWELAGPSNIGGRCTALLCDPSKPDRIWIGAAGGAVRASADAGKTWKQQDQSNTLLDM